jgi:hypothetical protein
LYVCMYFALRGAADVMKTRVQVGMCICIIWAASSHCVKYLIGVTVYKKREHGKLRLAICSSKELPVK